MFASFGGLRKTVLSIGFPCKNAVFTSIDLSSQLCDEIVKMANLMPILEHVGNLYESLVILQNYVHKATLL